MVCLVGLRFMQVLLTGFSLDTSAIFTSDLSEDFTDISVSEASDLSESDDSDLHCGPSLSTASKNW